MSLYLPALRPRGVVTVAAPAPAEAKAGPLGPGAGPLMTEWLLPTTLLGAADDQQRMARAMKVGMEVDWIRAAERAIRDALVRCAWHLEDPDDETIDSEYPDPIAVQAYELLKEPQGELPLEGPEGVGKRQSRRQQLTLTSRHLGLAGNAAWYLDAIDQLGLPHAICYISPDRLTPAGVRESGRLTGWLLDVRPGFDGTPVPLEQLQLLQFEPPDHGIFGPGLIESALAKATNSGLIDTHFMTLLRSGGRISGVLSPKEGAITDDTVYQQLVRDWRNITEQPEAARRLQIVRAPVDFTSTVQSAADMALVELMDRYRDSLLAIWGVPLTMLNGQNAGSTGLNGGEARKYDEAVLWQSAVDARLDEICEAYQHGILDRYEAALGWIPKLCFDKPTYDDETPAYDKAQKAVSLPLRNVERRAIIGLDPFGDPSLDNAVVMPINMAVMVMAPDQDTGDIPPEDSPDAPEEAEPEQPQLGPGQEYEDGAAPPMPPAMLKMQQAVAGAAKASLGRQTVNGHKVLSVGTRQLREQMEKRMVPKLQERVADALDRQGDAVAQAVERHWDSIVQHHGKDETQWWRPADLDKALQPLVATVAEQVEGHIQDALG